MTYKTTDDEIWTLEKGDWVSSKYYDKQELIKQIRRKNLIMIGFFAAYLITSVALIFF